MSLPLYDAPRKLGRPKREENLQPRPFDTQHCIIALGNTDKPIRNV
jgi:hypothetical protein